jgi:hypothetical protein
MDTVKEFGAQMERFGVWNWWRIGMGYQKDESTLKHYSNALHSAAHVSIH